MIVPLGQTALRASPDVLNSQHRTARQRCSRGPDQVGRTPAPRKVSAAYSASCLARLVSWKRFLGSYRNPSSPEKAGGRRSQGGTVKRRPFHFSTHRLLSVGGQASESWNYSERRRCRKACACRADEGVEQSHPRPPRPRRHSYLETRTCHLHGQSTSPAWARECPHPCHPLHCPQITFWHCRRAATPFL